jgi:Ca2+-binding EF-hand superfamily protein
VQCFADADVNHDGTLTFDEFKEWYLTTPRKFSAPPAVLLTSASAANFVGETEIHGLFHHYDANGDGVLNVSEFANYLTSVFKAMAFKPEFQVHGVSPEEMAESTALMYFDEADVNHDGTISFDEFKLWYSKTSSEIGAVTSAAPASSIAEHGFIDEAEVHGLFYHYDTNGDGLIDIDEFTTYLTSVFKAMAHKPEFQAHDVSPEEMAEATAKQCFDDADKNHDGTLTFDEFRAWYMTSPRDSDGPNVTSTDKGFIREAEVHGLFHHYDTNGDGLIDIGEFKTYLTTVFEALVDQPEFQAHGVSPEEMAEATAKQCFDDADKNHDGTLTFDEFKLWYSSSGVEDQPLSLNEHGVIDETEAHKAFTKFDANHDGVLDLGEFTNYLVAFFEALSETPAFQAYGSTPTRMAEATALQCFEEADKNHDGSLTFDEFKLWFQTSAGNEEDLAELVEEHEPFLHLAQDALWQCASQMGAPSSTSFDAEWWLSAAPTVRASHVASALASGAAVALRRALDESSSVAEDAIIFRELALALVLTGDVAEAVAALDKSLASDASGRDPSGNAGFVWGLKSRLLTALGGSEETALVCLLRVRKSTARNQTPIGSFKVDSSVFGGTFKDECSYVREAVLFGIADECFARRFGR